MVRLSKNLRMDLMRNSKSEVDESAVNPLETKTEARSGVMRMFRSRSRLLSAVIVSLIVSACLVSCLKHNYQSLSEIIDNTTWTGENECFFTVPDEETIKNTSYHGTVRISFVQDEVSISVEFYYSFQELDPVYNYWNTRSGTEIFKGNATYVCKGNDITIKDFRWNNNLAEQFGGDEWTGTYNENNGFMGLKNVFGDILTLRGGSYDYYYY